MIVLTDKKPAKTKLAAALSHVLPYEDKFARARPLPADMADVALADINDVKALIRMSDSWIFDRVRRGEFPAPVIRESRCTRWKLSDVRDYLVERVRVAAADTATAAKLTARAKHASDAAALSKRAGTAAATAE